MNDSPARSLSSEPEFLEELTNAVERYFRAVDAWEVKYRKYYRMPGQAHQVSPDLEAEQSEYAECRKRLEPLLGRARGLCFKYGIRDPWTGLLLTPLGRMAPQEGDLSAVPPSERALVNESLLRLRDAAAEWHQTPRPADCARGDAVGGRGGASWLKRFLDFFY